MSSQKTNPRAIAARIIAKVVMDGRSLSSAMDAVPAAAIDARPLIQEMCYGSLREFHRLDLIIAGLLKKPLKEKDGDVYGLLLLGVYQLLSMRVPDHAAVSETVAATGALKKPWARGLVNGILRNVQRRHESLLAQAQEDDEGLWSHPQWLIDALSQAWPDDWQDILTANNQRPPMTLRLSSAQGWTLSHKGSASTETVLKEAMVNETAADEYVGELQRAGIEARLSSATMNAILLDSPQDVSRLPDFAQGRVSVQDEAAQQAALLMGLADGQRVLDVCAAPGGKTGHMLELADVHMVAVDVDAGRLQRVEENLQRLNQQAECVVGDASQPNDWWDGEAFDRILLDAPCSATGVIRRHPDIKLLRQPEDILKLAALQAKILDAIWPLLKPGGMLLYATCSVLPQENVEQVAAFLSRQPDAQCKPLDVQWGQSVELGRQVLTGSAGMDGFYYACVEKKS
ncbi:MAG: 16S rRNA (cytosine(967)-C(5))-methyltransferase RsmB [Ectothiorhodospiraceae bacterium]|nr:16S rRNA (cytosine(967)-C(5))-methyltransferase RsmB [Ectothiorhodospiraceae bacterium]